MRVFAGYDADSVLAGIVIEAQGQGYADVIRLIYAYSFDCACIVGLKVLESRETPGLGDKMDKKKSDFPDQFIGKSPAEFTLKVTKDGGDVDAITAATISSRAFCDAVERAYTTYKNNGGSK